MKDLLPSTEMASCPRCGSLFVCKSGDIMRCACYGKKIDPSVTRKIAEKYLGCLCLACLEELNKPSITNSTS